MVMVGFLSAGSLKTHRRTCGLGLVLALLYLCLSLEQHGKFESIPSHLLKNVLNLILTVTKKG